MGTLTDDITRLCGEIVALRESREELLNALARASKDRGREVAHMLAGFRDALARVAKEGKANRVVFASNIRNAVTRLVKWVSDLRRGLAADIEGARKAWFGSKAAGCTDNLFPQAGRHYGPPALGKKTARPGVKPFGTLKARRLKPGSGSALLTAPSQSRGMVERLHAGAI